MSGPVDNPTPGGAGDSEENRSPVLDDLYDAMSHVQASGEARKSERDELLKKVESMETDLTSQRDAAAKSGDASAYKLLNGQLADLTRAYKVLSDDPDEDPFSPYQPEDHDGSTDQDSGGPAGDSGSSPDTGSGDDGGGPLGDHGDPGVGDGGGNPDGGQ